MTSISNYLENKLLDHSLGVASYTMPSTIYLALFTSDPTDAGSGTEVSGAAYARQAVTFATAASGATSNSTAESFTASGGNFGTVTHIGLFDALTTGNLLWHCPLNSSKIINNGETITFAVGDIDITLA